MRPPRYTIPTTAMFGRRAAFVPIPIGDRHCLTQRFSPTGFILNASKSNLSHPIVLPSHSGKNLSVQFNFTQNELLFLSKRLRLLLVNYTFFCFRPRDKQCSK